MNALMSSKKSGVVFICNECAADARAIGQWGVGSVGTDSICSWCKANLTQVAYLAAADAPFIGHSGVMTCSTSTTMELSRIFIYDVNRYYHSLGVDPHCTKAELRRAYQESGLDDVRLTAIAKVLLNDETRLEYDLLKIGQLWFDAELAAVVRDSMLAESEGSDISEPEAETMRKDVLAKEGRPVDLTHQDVTEYLEHPRGWGHYCWRIGPRDWLMGRWRALLCKAATDLGITLPYGLQVGVMRTHEAGAAYGVADLSVGRSIIFLREDVLATYELACEAVLCAVSPEGHHMQLT